jgi:N-acyl homoserine lactone hydrolase
MCVSCVRHLPLGVRRFEHHTGQKEGRASTNNSREETMNRILTILACGTSLFAGLATSAQAAPEMSLARFDCGTPQAPTAVNQRFSDTFAYGDLKIQFVFSCYLIKHGDDYLLWDTGHAMTAPNVAPNVSLVDYLAKIDVKPDQIKYVGISHYHADHTGQVASFPNATLLIGAKEWDAITAPKPAEGVNYKPFESWIKGDSKVEPVPTDKDVFGDGTVIMLRTPGHTAGHSSLLVKLPQMGAVILTGDAVHFHENYDSDGVPWFNYDRAQTVASIERIKKIASNLKATVIIQHDARDIEKLPVFPAFAK